MTLTIRQHIIQQQKYEINTYTRTKIFLSYKSMLNVLRHSFFILEDLKISSVRKSGEGAK